MTQDELVGSDLTWCAWLMRSGGSAAPQPVAPAPPALYRRIACAARADRPATLNQEEEQWHIPYQELRATTR
jgi:hypothetical protein